MSNNYNYQSNEPYYKAIKNKGFQSESHKNEFTKIGYPENPYAGLSEKQFTDRLADTFRDIDYYNKSIKRGISLYDSYDPNLSDEKNIQEYKKVFKDKAIHDSTSSGIFFEPDLNQYDPTLYRELYRDLTLWTRIIPQYKFQPGMRTFQYDTIKERGEAEEGSDNSNMTEKADVLIDRETGKTVMEKIEYSYTVEDLRQSALTTRKVDTLRMDAAKEAMARRLNKTIVNGDPKRNIQGILNNPNISKHVSGSNGGWKDATTKSISIIEDDILKPISTITKESDTASVNRTFTLVLATSPYNSLRRLLKPDAGGDSLILDHILRNLKGYQISNIEISADLDGAGEGGTDMGFIFPNKPEDIQLAVGSDILWDPLDYSKGEYTFTGRLYHGGLIVRRPKLCHYIYNI